MRRLLGARARPDGAAGRSGRRSTPAWSRPRPRRPGGRHRRGPRLAGRAAPGAARDGRARRVPVRLLHARVRLQHGRRVLPSPPTRGVPATTPDYVDHAERARAQRVRPPRPERQPLPLHRLPADPGRRATPSARRRRRPSSRLAELPHPWSGTPGSPSRTASSSVRPASTRPSTLLRRAPGRGRRRRLHRLGRRGQPPGVAPPLLVAVDRLPELRGFEVADDRADRRRADPHRDRAPLDGRIPLLDLTSSRSSRRG